MVLLRVVKNQTQSQLLAAIDMQTLARLDALRNRFEELAPIVASEVMLGKRNPDATGLFRQFLARAGVHDYERQELGAKVGKVRRRLKYISSDGESAAETLALEISLYRTRRGDRRYNISWPSRDLIDFGDVLVFIADASRNIILVNLKSENSSAPMVSSVWRTVEELVKIVADESAAEIVVADADPKPSTKMQGRTSDSALRSVIENHAVLVAKRIYGELGADYKAIQDVGKPYDLLVPLGAREVHAEVKGSMAHIEAVFITEGERIHSASYSDVELIVVDDIDAKFANGGWTATGGRARRWLSWKPSPESLKPINYRHQLGQTFELFDLGHGTDGLSRDDTLQRDAGPHA